MRNINGCHLFNDGGDGNHQYSDGWDRALAMAGPYGAVTMLHTVLHWYPTIRARYPQLLINLRFYTDNWTSRDARVWARENFQMVADTQPAMLQDPYVSWFGLNEQDLRHEGDSEGAYWNSEGDHRLNVAGSTFDRIFAYQFDYVDEMQMLKARHGVKAQIGCLALADGHEPEGEPPDNQYTRDSCKKVAARADVIWAHAYIRSDFWGDTPDREGYWLGLRPLRPLGYRERVQGLPPMAGIPDPGGVGTQFPGKIKLLVECGNANHGNTDPNAVNMTADQLRTLYWAYSHAGGWGCCTPFVWDTGSEHGFARFAGNPVLVQRMIDMERIPAADWPLGEGSVTIEEKVDMLLRQNALITEALKALRQGKFTGADGVDGYIVALQGGQPLSFVASWPPK